MKNGKAAVSFQITVQTVNGGCTWVRVNVFEEEIINYIRNKVKKGKDVYVEGELMNRRIGDTGQEAVEIRAFSVRAIRSVKARQIWKRRTLDVEENNGQERERTRTDNENIGDLA